MLTHHVRIPRDMSATLVYWQDDNTYTPLLGSNFSQTMEKGGRVCYQKSPVVTKPRYHLSVNMKPPFLSNQLVVLSLNHVHVYWPFYTTVPKLSLPIRAEVI